MLQGDLYRQRVEAVLMSLQYIVLHRWEQLRGYCTASAPPCEWPFEAQISDEFRLFEVAYNESGVHSFRENGDAGRGYVCDLACFRQEILG